MTASAGYSGTPLIKKLGIKPGFRAALLSTPEGYHGLLSELPPDVHIVTALEEHCDFIQYFASDYASLVADFPALKAALKSNGALWISWRKKSANPSGDISEDLIRQLALDAGLVDVKVIAVDATWSGLKLVYRLKDRPAT